MSEVVFARISDKGYLAGVEIGAVREFVRNAYSDVSDTAVSFVALEELPLIYRGCANHLRETTDWRSVGTFLLVKGFHEE